MYYVSFCPGALIECLFIKKQEKKDKENAELMLLEVIRLELLIQITVAAPLIAAASNQKMFSGQLAAASIQERLLIKK